MDSTRDANRITEFFVGEDVSLTVLALSPYNSCLFAGTSPLPRVCVYIYNKKASPPPDFVPTRPISRPTQATFNQPLPSLHPFPIPAPPGLDNGNIRVYEWPLNGSFVEYPCHKGPVSGLRVSFDHTRLLSTSEDGALMTFALQRYVFCRLMNSQISFTVHKCANFY
jgi:hypothetical protein